METLESIVTRRSVRKFSDKPVPRETIEKIVRAGTYAPTGRNAQSPIILAVTNKEIRDELSRINDQVKGGTGEADAFFGAPVVLVVLANKAHSTYVYDGSLVMGTLLLAAHDLGIASCWIHRAKETFERPEGKALLKKMGIEGEYEGIGNCILGYPAEALPAAKERKENWVYYID